ncbi:MAG: glycosyltransferase [Candidatus Omnitrophota bacterium]|nr:glycosyltransferase [Candidatus Omnitrophota bacterium]
MSSPVFSVIIATHNRAELLPRAIKSVLGQTFGDFELIVIDNGSTDDTKAVIESISDKRIRYAANPNPTGSCDVPRNIGIRMAWGEFVAFLDDDDTWYPNRLERVRIAFDANPDAACVCHDELRRVNGKPAGVIHSGPWSEDMLERLLYEGNRFSSCGTTIRTDAIRRAGGFDESNELSEVADYDLWIRMAKDGIRAFFIPGVLGEFNLTGSNWSSVSPAFAAKQAMMIQSHILRYEKKPLPRISRRGLWRLSQLYFITGRNYLKAKCFGKGIYFILMSLVFIARRPFILIDLCRKIREKMHDARMPPSEF